MVKSDCWTNFFGTIKEVRIEESINTYSTIKGLTWHFNPPGSRHMGGVWKNPVTIECDVQHDKNNVQRTYQRKNKDILSCKRWKQLVTITNQFWNLW